MDLLINRDDIGKYRPLAELPHGRIDNFVKESQEIDLAEALGDALYYDFISNYCDSSHSNYDNYQLLLKGTTYEYNGETIKYHGLKPMLSYFTLSRFILSQQVNYTRFGIVQKTDPNSQPIDSTQIKILSTEMKSIAIKYQTDLVKFLNEKENEYPLYKGDRPRQNTGFKFFSA